MSSTRGPRFHQGVGPSNDPVGSTVHGNAVEVLVERDLGDVAGVVLAVEIAALPRLSPYAKVRTRSR